MRTRQSGLTAGGAHGQCTPLLAPWCDGPHQPRNQCHTKTETQSNRAQLRTNRTQDCQIAVLWTQHRCLRVPDSANARSMSPSAHPPGSTVRIGRTTSTIHRKDTCAHAKRTDCAQGCEDATLLTQRRRGMRTCPPDPTQATGSTMAPPWRPPSWRRALGQGTEPCSVPVCLPVLSDPVFGGVALLRQ